MILIRQWNNVDTRTELVFYCSIQFGLLQLSSSNQYYTKSGQYLKIKIENIVFPICAYVLIPGHPSQLAI
jgi:hypothetical protein